MDISFWAGCEEEKILGTGYNLRYSLKSLFSNPIWKIKGLRVYELMELIPYMV